MRPWLPAALLLVACNGKGDPTDPPVDTDPPARPCSYPPPCPATGGIPWTPGQAPEVMFVVDHGASMAQAHDMQDDSIPDFVETRAELVQLLAATYLDGVGAQADLGLTVCRDGTCEVALPVGPTVNATTIGAALREQGEPTGRVPLDVALEVTADTCFAHPYWDNIAILVSDGEGLDIGSCGEGDRSCQTDGLRAAIDRLIPSAEARVELYSIYVGAATDALPPLLQDVRTLSSGLGTTTPIVYDVHSTADPGALQARLFATLDGRGPCSFALELPEGQSIDEDALRVVLEGELIPRCPDQGECRKGWRSNGERVVELIGEACRPPGADPDREGNCPDITFEQ